MSKFNLTNFDDGETIEDYTLCLSGMAAHLTTLSEEVKDGEIVSKMLQKLPPRFKQIKTLLDVVTMSAADLTGRLKEPDKTFYLTEEDWDARRKKRETENHSSDSVGKSHGRGGSSSGGSSNKPTGDECRRCGKTGHWAHECRSKPKKE
jgi:hypothetical protein